MRRSRRKHYTYYVIGQLMQIALTLYDVIVDISVVDERQEEGGCHVTFRLDFDNTEAAGRVPAENSCSELNRAICCQLPAVNGFTFFKVNQSDVSIASVPSLLFERK